MKFNSVPDSEAIALSSFSKTNLVGYSSRCYVVDNFKRIQIDFGESIGNVVLPGKLLDNGYLLSFKGVANPCDS